MRVANDLQKTLSDILDRRDGGLRCKGLYPRRSLGKPLISIITVVWNGEKHLENTIRSVINQSYDAIEYIIIDGGSTDATLDILKKYDDKIDYWLSEPDAGIYDAMNKGIALTTGELIGIINADDFYLDGAINKIVSAAMQYPAASVFHANLKMIFPDNTSLIYYSKQKLSKNDVYLMPVYHPTVFIRRECYERYGLFDTQYKFVADYDLILRLLLDHKLIFHYLNETITCMRWGGATCIHRWQDTIDLNNILMSKKPSLYLLIRWKIRYMRRLFSFICSKSKIISSIIPHYRKLRILLSNLQTLITS